MRAINQHKVKCTTKKNEIYCILDIFFVKVTINMAVLTFDRDNTKQGWMFIAVQNQNGSICEGRLPKNRSDLVTCSALLIDTCDL